MFQTSARNKLNAYLEKEFSDLLGTVISIEELSFTFLEDCTEALSFVNVIFKNKKFMENWVLVAMSFNLVEKLIKFGNLNDNDLEFIVKVIEKFIKLESNFLKFGAIRVCKFLF